jgi:hypothetical protein
VIASRPPGSRPAPEAAHEPRHVVEEEDPEHRHDGVERRLGRLELRHVGRPQVDLRQPGGLLARDREHLLGVVDADD